MNVKAMKKASTLSVLFFVAAIVKGTQAAREHELFAVTLRLKKQFAGLFFKDLV